MMNPTHLTLKKGSTATGNLGSEKTPNLGIAKLVKGDVEKIYAATGIRGDQPRPILFISSLFTLLGFG